MIYVNTIYYMRVSPALATLEKASLAAAKLFCILQQYCIIVIIL